MMKNEVSDRSVILWSLTWVFNFYLSKCSASNNRIELKCTNHFIFSNLSKMIYNTNITFCFMVKYLK